MTHPTPASAAHQIILTDLGVTTTAPGAVEESAARVATQLLGSSVF